MLSVPSSENCGLKFQMLFFSCWLGLLVKFFPKFLGLRAASAGGSRLVADLPPVKKDTCRTCRRQVADGRYGKSRYKMFGRVGPDGSKTRKCVENRYLMSVSPRIETLRYNSRIHHGTVQYNHRDSLNNWL